MNEDLNVHRDSMTQYFEKNGAPAPVFLAFINALNSEFYWLRCLSKFYDQLFESGGAQFYALNSNTPSLHNLLRVSIIHAMCLSLSRLTDQPKSSNLSILAIIQIIKGHQNPPFLAQIETKCELLNARIESIRNLRDKWLAHKDKGAYIRNIPIPAFEYHVVADAILIMAEILSPIHSHYFHSDLDYDYVGMLGDGNTLIRIFKMAKEH